MGDAADLAKKALELCRAYRQPMVQFLRDMIAIPSESAQEGPLVGRIRREMERVGAFDEISVDSMGNILGRLGNGPVVIAIDAHIDTVGGGDLSQWAHDPYKGKLEDGVVYGRGAADQKGGMASMVYAARVMRDLGLVGPDHSIYFVGTVQEEDCDGLCWQYLVKEHGLRPEVVVLTEPTNLNVYRGHRGRMEIQVVTRGVSAHGSAPERGVNAIYKMGPIISGIEKLNELLAHDDFLGKGSVVVSYIECDTPSLCAVPDRCMIHLDRRLTRGEDKEVALEQVKAVVREAGADAEVAVPVYSRPSYTGLIYPAEKYYPTWTVEEESPAVRAAAETCVRLFGKEPVVDKWTFSTNGVATMGMFGIPTIGFGPGNEVHAHSIEDQVPVEHLVSAAAFYSIFHLAYRGHK